MDELNGPFLAHVYPLILVSGVKSLDSSVTSLADSIDVPCDFGSVPEEIQTKLRALFDSATSDTTTSIWNSALCKSNASDSRKLFNVRYTDTKWRFPLIRSKPDSSTESLPLSVLSPSNPASDIFPAGYMSLSWCLKYSSIVPSIFVQCIHSTDPDPASLIDQIKALKLMLDDYKVKFYLVLTDPTIFADTVTKIQKLACLDSKSNLLICPAALHDADPLTVPLLDWSSKVLATLYRSSMEYYSNTIKRIRRKKSRISRSPTPEDSTALPALGWSSRYDFKIGYLSECRFEIDIAAKAYENAYESLLEMMRDIPSAHPRWSHYRFFLDVIAFRILRCHLYLNHIAQAARKFHVHVSSLGEIYKPFTQSEKSSIPAYSLVIAKMCEVVAKLLLLAPSEISSPEHPFAQGPVPDPTPFDVLSNAGFQLLDAYVLFERSNGKNDLTAQIISILQQAEKYFPERHSHTHLYITYELSLALESQGNFRESLRGLLSILPLALNTLSTGLLIDMTDKALLAASKIEDHKWGFLLTILRSLLGSYIPQAIPSPGVSSVVYPRDFKSILSYEITFKDPEVQLGDPCYFQLRIVRNDDLSLPFSNIDILSFNVSGSSYSWDIKHSKGPSSYPTILESHQCQANMTFKEDFIVLEGRFLADTLGPISVQDIAAELEIDSCKIDHSPILIPRKEVDPAYWRTENSKIILSGIRNTSLCIPKIPQIDISNDLDEIVLVKETFSKSFCLTNRERCAINGTFTVKYTVKDTDDNDSDSGKDSSTLQDNVPFQISPNEKEIIKFKMQAPDNICESEISLHLEYHLLDDEDSRTLELTKRFRLSVLNPFRLSFKFSPSPNPEWGSVFSGKLAEYPPVSRRLWNLGISIAALNSDELEIIAHELLLDDLVNVEAAVKEYRLCELPQSLKPGPMITNRFIIGVSSLKDVTKRTGSMQVFSIIKWRRKGTEDIHVFDTQSLSLQLPLLEPRVLFSLENQEGEIYKCRYYIENPTSFLLNFTFQCKSNEDIAFQGTVKKELTVLPYSRITEDVYLLPLRSGRLRIPMATIHDTRFNKTLSVTPVDEIFPVEQNGGVFLNV
ncbi:hypothetical protein CANCADRAFT_130299 [Tortispora caseinolytica NRRL Y-17796]|uniref:Trafficking protein particle complex subunit 11 domain-containing protein n=1 Tax=Tortispora caseinolytica NRRL Y-17796 TaxID=767744 RepID=A0A1E4TAY4_9ASCO|nr:hypothetical protein CANCADRAFT_130299 [Tortispora caseinolytica NRRL Y-17796]